MAINYQTIIDNNLLNHIGVMYQTYYHTKRQCFCFRDRLPGNSKYFVETPYQKGCQNLAWKYFYEMLNDEELALAKSFDEKYGFFDFMRQTGLISIFDAALERATVQVFARWESENDLSIDWNNVVIE